MIYSGKTDRCLPQTSFPTDWDPTFTDNHWSNETSMLQYVDKILLPYIEKCREELQQPDQKAVVIMDYFAAHRTGSLKEKLIANNIDYHYVLAACTDQLQPLDLSLNKQYKDELKLKYNKWYANQVATQLDESEDPDMLMVKIDTHVSVIKPLHAAWLIEVHQQMSTRSDLILDGFKKAGLIKKD